MKTIAIILSQFILILYGCNPDTDCNHGYSNDNGSCNCIGGWHGARCNLCDLDCVHGKPDAECLACECESGYGGRLCDSLYNTICNETFENGVNDYLITQQYNFNTTNYNCSCEYVDDSTFFIVGFDGFLDYDVYAEVNLDDCTIKDQTFTNSHGSYQILSSGSTINGTMSPQIIISFLKDNQDITICQFSRQ